MTRTLVTLGVAGALALSLPAVAQSVAADAPSPTGLATQATAPLPNADAAFLMDAIRTDLAEMKLAELAQQRGESDAVRDFGKALAADHTKSMQAFADIAAELAVTPPTTLSSEATQAFEHLAALSGKDFDRAFASHIVMGHQQAIKRFTTEATTSTNAKVSSAAADTLPTLRRHLETAQTLERKLAS